MANSNVTGASLHSLCVLARLTYLFLGDTKGDDKEVVGLEGLGALEYLFIHDTQISETALNSLRELSSLQPPCGAVVLA